ncbi:MFS sugar transporter [Aspergillus udagawae]|uniref:MFS sugar transporter n=1 Tax=Aspergillus udagawae TaxID=91492 RepID=A0A8H3XRB4_9EURO|nr:MFS sugar transporter [Aspergillus udagawae]
MITPFSGATSFMGGNQRAPKPCAGCCWVPEPRPSSSSKFLSFLVITILLCFTENNKVYGTTSIAFFFLYYITFGVGMLGVP